MGGSEPQGLMHAQDPKQLRLLSTSEVQRTLTVAQAVQRTLTGMDVKRLMLLSVVLQSPAPR